MGIDDRKEYLEASRFVTRGYRCYRRGTVVCFVQAREGCGLLPSLEASSGAPSALPVFSERDTLWGAASTPDLFFKSSPHPADQAKAIQMLAIRARSLGYELQPLKSKPWKIQSAAVISGDPWCDQRSGDCASTAAFSSAQVHFLWLLNCNSRRPMSGSCFFPGNR